jgi:hypothetical protein
MQKEYRHLNNLISMSYALRVWYPNSVVLLVVMVRLPIRLKCTVKSCVPIGVSCVKILRIPRECLVLQASTTAILAILSSPVHIRVRCTVYALDPNLCPQSGCILYIFLYRISARVGNRPKLILIDCGSKLGRSTEFKRIAQLHGYLIPTVGPDKSTMNYAQ